MAARFFARIVGDGRADRERAPFSFEFSQRQKIYGRHRASRR